VTGRSERRRAALHVGLLMASHYAMKSLRTAALVEHVGAAGLPGCRVAEAVAAVVAVLWYGRLLAAGRRRAAVLVHVAALAGHFVFGAALAVGSSTLVAAAAVVGHGLSLVVLAAFWGALNDGTAGRGDDGRCMAAGTGGLIGGLVGCSVVWTAPAGGSWVPTLAFAVATAATATYLTGTGASMVEATETISWHGTFARILGDGVACRVALTVVFGAAALTALDQSFHASLAESFDGMHAGRAGYLGRVHGATLIVGLLCQTTLTGVVLRRGPWRGLLLLPGLCAAGAVVTGATTSLPVLSWLHVVVGGVALSVQTVCREAAFLDADGAVRRCARPVIDGLGHRLGDGLAGCCMLVGTAPSVALAVSLTWFTVQASTVDLPSPLAHRRRSA